MTDTTEAQGKNLVIEITRALLTSLETGDFAQPERGVIVLFDTDKKVSIFGLGGEEGEGLVITAALLKRAFELIAQNSDTLAGTLTAPNEGVSNDG